MANTPDDLLDRYLSGETSPQEERALMQAALDDPALFDLLTTAGLADGALRAGVAQPAMVTRPRWSPVTKTLFVGTGLAAAAALALVVASAVRSPSSVIGDSSVASAPAPSPTPNQPAEAIALNAPRPIFLSALLNDSAATTPPEFRAAPAAEQLPKPEGTIKTLAAGIAEVDLGANDGLANGSVLTVISGEAASAPTGLTVTRVFRDRARGEVPPGLPLRAGDRVRVDSTDRLLALVEQIGARRLRGDAKTAQQLASEALTLAQATAIRADARRDALAQVAALAHQSGDVAAAERHLNAVAREFESRPVASAVERTGILNALGMIAATRGDLAGAEEVLLRAQTSAPATGAFAVQVINNLGAVAAMRGDRARAEGFYLAAQKLAGTAALRPAVDQNLAALRSAQ